MKLRTQIKWLHRVSDEIRTGKMEGVHESLRPSAITAIQNEVNRLRKMKALARAKRRAL